MKYLILLLTTYSTLVFSSPKQDECELLDKHTTKDIEVWLGFLNTFYIKQDIVSSLTQDINEKTTQDNVTCILEEFSTRIVRIKKRKNPHLLIAEPRLFKDKQGKETENMILFKKIMTEKLCKLIPNLSIDFFDDMNNTELLKIISSNKRKLYIDNRVEFWPGQASIQLPEELKKSLISREKHKYCMWVSRFSTEGLLINNIIHFEQAKKFISSHSHSYTNFHQWNLENPKYKIKIHKSLEPHLKKKQRSSSRINTLYNFTKSKIYKLRCKFKKSKITPARSISNL
jgi:hypothetical protein